MDLTTAREGLLKAIAPAAEASRKTGLAEKYQAEWEREVQARRVAEERAAEKERRAAEREEPERQEWDRIARLFLDAMDRGKP